MEEGWYSNFLASGGEGKGSEAIEVLEWASKLRLVRILYYQSNLINIYKPWKKSLTRVNCNDHIAELI